MKRKMNHKLSEEECLPASAKPNRADKDNEQRDSSFNRVMAIMDEVNSSFKFDEFVKSRGATHVKSYQSGYDVGKNITIGLVRTHVNAARAALKMFQEGHDEDARAVFDPDILLELMKHKRKLGIYLSPFSPW
uniref:Uncharacterized protein n=1 Tax=Noccaea caerulescens TaxID=107243 RepID=A0A1J3GW54_NOCCA